MKKSSALRRAAKFASMTAGVTGSYLGYLAQSVVLNRNTRAEKLAATHRKAGKRLTETMGELRGPAMKLGQTLSLHSGTLPDEALEELAALQMSAPPMHPQLVRAQFRQELGRDPEEVFRSFDPEPFAAASLGQVHNAVGRQGQPLAVKIQYPAIREAIAGDFKWFRALSQPAQLSKHLPADTLDELQKQIELETDYRLEADQLEYFRAALKPLAWVRVPQVYREFSSGRVLTMSKLKGQHLGAFLAARPSRKLCDEIGAHLVEMYYFQVLRLGRFHADPHWGNFLFTSDAGIELVDFGCVKRLHPEFVSSLRALYLYPGRRDSGEFVEGLEERYRSFGKKLSPAARRAHISFAESFYRDVYPPEVEKEWQATDFGDPRWLRQFFAEARKLSNSRGTLPEYLFLARTELGLYQTLHKLSARVPMSVYVRRYQTV